MEHRSAEVRSVAPAQRVVTVMVAPYNEISHLTDNPSGERFQRGAFTASLRGRERTIKLLRGHSTDRVYGMSKSFRETSEGLVSEFEIRHGAPGDELLDDLSGGYMDVSAGFIVEKASHGPGGVRLVERARLFEVSAVAIPAYAGSRVLATRSAHTTPPRRTLEPWESPRRWQ